MLQQTRKSAHVCAHCTHAVTAGANAAEATLVAHSAAPRCANHRGELCNVVSSDEQLTPALVGPATRRLLSAISCRQLCRQERFEAIHEISIACRHACAACSVQPRRRSLHTCIRRGQVIVGDAAVCVKAGQLETQGRALVLVMVAVVVTGGVHMLKQGRQG